MTPTRETLLALAERVEALIAPDRKVDAKVAAAANHGQDRDGFLYEWCAQGSTDRLLTPDYYTASLDAAMTLVPEGFDWIIGHTNGGLTIHAEVGGRGDEFMRFGETPALALTAAALRARATLTDHPVTSEEVGDV